MIGPEDRYYGRIWSFHDISGFKQTEARLSVQTDAMEATIDGLAIFDSDQKFIYLNQSFACIHGYEDAGELLGRGWHILYNSDELNRFASDVEPEIRKKSHYQGRALGMKKDGRVFPQSFSLTALKNGGMICTIRDISEQVAAEQELIQAKEKAIESDRLKSAFLANMSHEVRTPLNSIIGFSELLADTYFDEEQKNEFIQSIIKSGNSLLSIINDIMDISKLESGEMTIRKTKLNSREFLSGVKEQFSFQAEAKNIGFKLLLPETDEETYIMADPGRLMQIFNNLVGNALKFTEKGAIEISYQQRDKNVEFQIRDSGIGIAPEYHHKVFDRFRQVETSTTRKFGGNGLGLAITKNLVELMGGQVWLESEPCKGSVFYFTMPVYIRS
jgi:PAS domain S-box-containing protein